MERRKFDDFAELGNHMYELARDESQVVTAVLLYEDTLNLIRGLILYDDVTVCSISIENEDYHGYDKEFYITLNTDLVLDVVPAYRLPIDETDNGYLPLESDVILYGGDVSSKLALQNTHGNKYEIIIENYDDDSKTEFKSTTELLRDISEIYDELTDKQQAGLLEKLAGKRQGQNEDECGDCCGDCSNCPHRENSETIFGTLGIFDYILNHLGDN